MNSIATTKGGTHVDYITNQITNHIMNFVNKKNKNANIEAHNVKNYLWVFDFLSMLLLTTLLLIPKLKKL